MRDDMVHEADDVYGLRRGGDNWRFPWLPARLEPPITWDHLVRNVHDVPLHTLPQPLCQHAARARLDAGAHAPVGTVWHRARSGPTEAEVAWARAHPGEAPALPHRLLVDAVGDDADSLDAGFDGAVDGVEAARLVGGVPHTMVRAHDAWYVPGDPTAALRAKIPARRAVSAALSQAQSRQLIEVFFHLTTWVDGSPPRRALELVLFQYMVQRGYTARWLGKYEQAAHHVGNGDSFRAFRAMRQYEPSNLPTRVLNRLCSRDGVLSNRGSKGSRSKYKSNRARYVPQRRLGRSAEDERRLCE